MIPNQILLPTEAFDDLATLAGNPAIMEAFRAHASQIAAAQSLSDALGGLARAANLERDDVLNVARALLGLHSLRRNLEVSAQDLEGILDRSVRAQAPPEWRAAHMAGWERQQGVLADLLEPRHPLGLLEKSDRLAYSYAKILTGSQLIADLRPVFDDGADAVARMSVSFVLMLEFSEHNRPRRIDLALDAEDIETLLNQCTRAKKKAETLKSALRDLPWPVSVAGASTGAAEDGDSE